MFKSYSTRFPLILYLSDLTLLILAQGASIWLRNTLPYGKSVSVFMIPPILWQVYPLITLLVFNRE